MRVLFVEKDLGYINSFMTELTRDYVVDIAHTGEDGAYLSEVNDYDVILVSDSLPDCNGVDMCSITRNLNSVSPIVLLTDSYDPEKIVQSLESGANLCFPRTCTPKKLCNGLSLLIRNSNVSKNTKVIINDIEFDFSNKLVKVKGLEIKLRRKEYDILEYLILKRNKIVSKEELLEHMWVSGIYILSNTVEVHVTNIRNALERPFGIKLIETVRGFGYRIRS